MLVWIHACVVETKVELRRSRIGVIEKPPDRGQVVRASLHERKPGSFRTQVPVIAAHGNVDLPDAWLIRDQRRRAPAAMRVEIQNKHGPRSGRQRRVGGDREAVEGAEACPAPATGMMQAAGKRTGRAVLQRRQCSG